MPKLDRRAFVRQSLSLTAALGVVAQGCGLFDEPEMRICSLAEAEAAPFITATFNGDKILLKKEANQWVVYSLVCRHRRCTVAWMPTDQIFACPCHAGRYDAEGAVISGPPPGPLRKFQHEIRGTDMWVLNSYL